MELVVQPEKFQSGFLEEKITTNENFARQALEKVSQPDFAEHFEAPVDVFDTVIISDIHLGAKYSRTQELLLFLETVKFRRLIINGDVFDDINMKRLNRHHWRILSCLRELTDRDNDIDVIWIRGNHDGYSDLLSQLLGIDFIDEFIFTWNDKRALVVHGDYFDRFVTSKKIVGELGSLLYHLAFYIDPEHRRIGSWLKQNSRTFQRNLQKVREGAAAYARHKRADIVICGHTHYVENTEVNGVQYLNLGSWAGDTPSYFVGVTQDELKLTPFM